MSLECVLQDSLCDDLGLEESTRAADFLRFFRFGFLFICKAGSIDIGRQSYKSKVYQEMQVRFEVHPSYLE